MPSLKLNAVHPVVFVRCLKTYCLLSVRTQLPLFRNSFMFLRFTTAIGASVRYFRGR